MTWEPRNKTNDGHDSDDKESIAGSEDGSSCDVQQHHGDGCTTRNGNSSSSNNNSSNDRHHRHSHRSDQHVVVAPVSPVSHHHYPIVKTEGLTTITDLSCTDKRSAAAILSHHAISGNAFICFLLLCLINDALQKGKKSRKTEST